MSKRITQVERGSLTGHGRTQTEAKADLEERIDKALTGNYRPLLVRCYGHTALIWRELDGWGYKITSLARVNSDHSATLFSNGSVSNTRAKVERQARFHLAQMAFQIGGPTGLCVIENPDDRREHVNWCSFQYAYQEWRETGLDDTKAHYEAGHCRWPEGVEPVDIASLPE